MGRVFLLFLLCLVGSCACYVWAINVEISQRDENALYAHYSGRPVRILDSEEFPSDQTCYEVAIGEYRPAPARHTFVMISSAGADQDNWGFSGEFGSMHECKAALNHG